MANKALEPAVQARGYCCPYAFMQMADKRGYSHSQVAELLGVCKRTAKNWRNKPKQCKDGDPCGQTRPKTQPKVMPRFTDWLDKRSKLPHHFN